MPCQYFRVLALYPVFALYFCSHFRSLPIAIFALSHFTQTYLAPFGCNTIGGQRKFDVSPPPVRAVSCICITTAGENILQIETVRCNCLPNWPNRPGGRLIRPHQSALVPSIGPVIIVNRYLSLKPVRTMDIFAVFYRSTGTNEMQIC